MGMTDNKVLGWNINLGQFLGLIAIAAGVVLAVWTDSLVIGYVVMTLALCAFFLAVAFDVGVPKRTDRDSAAGTDGR